MTITIPPFVCGVIATLLVEILLGTLMRKKEDKKNGRVKGNHNEDNSNE